MRSLRSPAPSRLVVAVSLALAAPAARAQTAPTASDAPHETAPPPPPESAAPPDAAPPALVPAPAPTPVPSPPPAPKPQSSYIARSLLLPPGGLAFHFGVGIAGSHIAAGFGNGLDGIGLHAEAVLGLLRRIEIDGGVGLRIESVVLGSTALLAPDRYARVGMDEVFQTGNQSLGNPYARVRVGILDRPDIPVHVAVEGMTVVPLATATAWGFGFGVPLHLTLRPWLRVETGLFVLLIDSSSSQLQNVVSVPLRVDFALGSRFVLGLVTGVNAGNLLRNDPYPAQIPLGLLGILRLEPRTDLVFQWLFPTFAPEGVSAGGFGIGIIERLL